jgi:hypothetical protein
MSIVAALSLISVPLMIVLMINYMERIDEPPNYYTVLYITLITMSVKIISAFFSQHTYLRYHRLG